jgi:dihydroflavonol-4-reductase
MMKAVVTGASGLLGGNLAVLLRERGAEVRATRRGSTRVDHLDGHGIEWVDADLGSATSLAEAFAGADVVFHCAAAVDIKRTITRELVRSNVDGTRNVLAAARAIGLSRLVHCSTVGAVGLSEDGDPCTEDSRWNFADHDLADGYVTTKRWSEDLVMAAAEVDLDAVVVNPTYMFGPFDPRPSSGKMIVEVVKGRVPGWTTGYNNFVDVRDVARGMILAAERGARGRRYILSGENMSYREVMQRIAAVAGVSPPRLGIPRWAAAVIGAVGDVQERTGSEAFINSVSVAYGFTPRFIFSCARARAELGYEPGPIEPAIADAITWFRARGML